MAWLPKSMVHILSVSVLLLSTAAVQANENCLGNRVYKDTTTAQICNTQQNTCVKLCYVSPYWPSERAQASLGRMMYAVGNFDTTVSEEGNPSHSGISRSQIDEALSTVDWSSNRKLQIFFLTVEISKERGS